MSGTRLCPEGSGEPLEGSTYGRGDEVTLARMWLLDGSRREKVLGAVGVQRTVPLSIQHISYRGAVCGVRQ